MSLMLVAQNYVPANVMQCAHMKRLRVVGGMVCVAHITWKCLKLLAKCGNSKYALLRFLQRHLRYYLNTGWLIRGEFSASLPWHYMFLSDGKYAIVNYGSYGTVPIAVQEYHLKKQRETELCPDFFYRITYYSECENSRRIVGNAVNCRYDNLVFVDNATVAMNATLRSLFSSFAPGDAVLCLRDFAYGAVLKTVDTFSKLYSVEVVNVDILLPIASSEQVCSIIEGALKENPNVKVAIFDHISSAAAILFPVKRLAEICRANDVISVIDGAHAPGQLHLDIEDLDADVYIGNLYKWYFTPKSCAILCVKEWLHDRIQPTVVSHNQYMSFQMRFIFQGTKNNSAILTAGYAVGEYTEQLGGIDHLHSYITPLVEWATELFARTWNTRELELPADMKAPYMRVVYLPQIFNEIYSPQDGDDIILEMLKESRLVIFVNPIVDKLCVRVSAQIFSTRNEYVYAAYVIKQKVEQLKKIKDAK